MYQTDSLHIPDSRGGEYGNSSNQEQTISPQIGLKEASHLTHLSSQSILSGWILAQEMPHQGPKDKGWTKRKYRRQGCPGPLTHYHLCRSGTPFMLDGGRVAMAPACQQIRSTQRLSHLLFLQQTVMELRRRCMVSEGLSRLEHGGDLSRGSGRDGK